MKFDEFWFDTGWPVLVMIVAIVIAFIVLVALQMSTTAAKPVAVTVAGVATVPARGGAHVRRGPVPTHGGSAVRQFKLIDRDAPKQPVNGGPTFTLYGLVHQTDWSAIEFDRIASMAPGQTLIFGNIAVERVQ